MNRLTRFVLFVAVCGCNIFFYYLCGYWEQMVTSQTPAIDFLYGIVAMVALGMTETRFAVQILFRCRFIAYKKKTFDYCIWVQAAMLLVYYGAAVAFVRSVEFIHGIFYIAVMALLMAIAWFGWFKGGRVLWVGEKDSWFMDTDGKCYKVKRITENEDFVFITCMFNRLREKQIVIPKGTLDKIKAGNKLFAGEWNGEDAKDREEADKIEAFMDAAIIADSDAAHGGCKAQSKLYGRGIR